MTRSIIVSGKYVVFCVWRLLIISILQSFSLSNFVQSTTDHIKLLHHDALVAPCHNSKNLLRGINNITKAVGWAPPLSNPSPCCHPQPKMLFVNLHICACVQMKQKIINMPKNKQNRIQTLHNFLSISDNPSQKLWDHSNKSMIEPPLPPTEQCWL